MTDFETKVKEWADAQYGACSDAHHFMIVAETAAAFGYRLAVALLRSKEAKEYNEQNELVPREYWADWLAERGPKT